MSDLREDGGGFTRIALIAAVAILAVGAGAYFLLGDLTRTAETPPVLPASAGPTPSAPPANAVAERLVPIITAARDASSKALAAAKSGEAVAAEANAVAEKAAAFAAKGKEAAAEAKRIGDEACKAPSDKMACVDAEDGTHYAGAQSCKGDLGCGPEGYGVLSDKKRGWVSEGQWTDWSLVLGCDSLNGAVTYCGQQAASAWSGFGISYNANDAAISAEWAKGAGKSPMQLDYPTGSRMRGQMAKYLLDGLGVYDRSDGRTLEGAWKAGNLVSGTVSYGTSGTIVSGDFADSNASLGIITWKDGRTFVGRIEDGPAIAEARPLEGAIYSPAGAIIQQGTWKNGLYSGP